MYLGATEVAIGVVVMTTVGAPVLMVDAGLVMAVIGGYEIISGLQEIEDYRG